MCPIWLKKLHPAKSPHYLLNSENTLNHSNSWTILNGKVLERLTPMTTTSNTFFASQYDRDEHGWIKFPRDVDHRKEVGFPYKRKASKGEDDESEDTEDTGELSVFDHPAKMQLFLTEEVIKHYSKEGDSILDPFGGTGSTAIGCQMSRQVTLLELEPIFLPILEYVQREWLERNFPPPAVIPGDCKQTLKQIKEGSYDLIVTSPPYANLQVGKVKTEFTGQLASYKAQAMQYGSAAASAQNFGRLNTWMFNQEMDKVWKECLRVLKPGGYYVSVTKDQMRGKDRILLSAEIVRHALAAGFKYTGEWYKWLTPGGMLQGVMRAKGADVVRDEDVIVFRKPIS